MSRPRLRRLASDDLLLLHGWLNEPGVVRWWEGDDVSWEGVVDQYWSTVDDHVEHWIAELDGVPFGWAQCWDAATELARDPGGEVPGWLAAGVDLDGLAGIDYLVGDPGDRGAGRGSAMIDAFVTDVVLGADTTWRTVAASPYLANTASWRALARAGFTHLADVVHEGDEEPCRLMVRHRAPG